MNCFGCRRLNSPVASAQDGTDETTISLNASYPRALFGFALRTMADHESVTDIAYFKNQMPSEVFLTGLFVAFQSVLPELLNQPLTHIVSKAERIDEIVLRLGHIEGRAFKSNERSNFGLHVCNEHDSLRI